MRTRGRARFLAKGTSSEERVGFQFVCSAFAFFCFCFGVFCLVLFLFPLLLFLSCSIFFLFLFLLLVFPLPPSFSLAYTWHLTRSTTHPKLYSSLFSSPLNLKNDRNCHENVPDFRSCLMIDLGRETDGYNEVCLGVRVLPCAWLDPLVTPFRTNRTTFRQTLNAAFARQCSAPSAAHPPRLSTSSSSFAFQPITEESTFKALRGVLIRKASGLDDLPARLLFECAAEIAVPLCYIFNLSLSSGLFSSQWKIACIQPVFKNKGDRCDPLSYRPIALLPIVSKVFEKLVHRQVLNYCLSYGFIPDKFGNCSR